MRDKWEFSPLSQMEEGQDKFFRTTDLLLLQQPAKPATCWQRLRQDRSFLATVLLWCLSSLLKLDLGRSFHPNLQPQANMFVQLQNGS
jgi:hypothetical protein